MRYQLMPECGLKELLAMEPGPMREHRICHAVALLERGVTAKAAAAASGISDEEGRLLEEAYRERDGVEQCVCAWGRCGATVREIEAALPVSKSTAQRILARNGINNDRNRGSRCRTQQTS